MIYSIKNIIKSIFIILENTLFSESVIKLTSLFLYTQHEMRSCMKHLEGCLIS